jgi:hypothetical protein
MQLTITLPDAVHSLLAAHAKGPEAAVLIAIKRYLKATVSEGRDQAIADAAVRGATHAELANKYALSIPRIQQLVALGRDAALLRNPLAPKPAPTTTTPAPKPKRPSRGVLTPQDIHNIQRMRSEGALTSEMMQVFSISMSELQDALWSAPPTHTTTTRTSTPARTTPNPAHDFEFDMREITG